MIGAKYLRLLGTLVAAGGMALGFAAGAAQGIKPKRGCPDSFTLIDVRDATDDAVDFNNDDKVCTKPLPSGEGDENIIDNTSHH